VPRDSGPSPSQEQGHPAPGAVSRLLEELAEAPASDVGDGWRDWLAPGVVAGRYELVREIGRGGFGVVWEAIDRESGRRVAFKAVRPGGKSEVREARLLQEAEVSARLSHPGIVSLLDVGRSPHGPFLVLELLRGWTLASRLDYGGLLPAEALRLGAATAAALAHAHAHGVVHRDLKPANVFLCEDGGVKVLDFGLAHALGHRRADGGTPAYMAPEQRRGAPEDERTDVFALGVLLHRLLAGELPFPALAGRAVQGPEPAPALEVVGAPSFGPLLSRMLEKDPVRRPRDAGEVLPGIEAAREDLARAPSQVAAAPVRVRRLPSADARAYDYCLRARQFLMVPLKANLKFASEMFARAVEVDPRYAPAHAGLAEGAAQMHMYYPSSKGDQLEVAHAASARALELDPGLAEAHAGRGLALFLSRRMEEAEREFQIAIAADPSLPEARYYYARACFQQGRHAEAARLCREANAAREGYQAAFFAAQASEAAGERAEALEAYHLALAVCERHMEMNPDDPRAATMRAVCLARIGRREDGLHWARQALAIDPLDPGVRYNVACLYAIEGAAHEALDCLEQVVRAGFQNPEWMEKDPDLSSLRGLPRFRALMEGLGSAPPAPPLPLTSGT
jgi:tetratricopeptide (TPR) repeat protein